ncbi:MAG: hypothetical protein LBJ61_03490 [Deltaproteobacteria bacterium]|nr:hypothetical protein [Deltaproteobacteria bacterium]
MWDRLRAYIFGPALTRVTHPSPLAGDRKNIAGFTLGQAEAWLTADAEPLAAPTSTSFPRGP